MGIIKNMLTQYKSSDIIVSEGQKSTEKDYSRDISIIISELNRLKNRVSLLERENRRLKVQFESLPRK